MQSYVDANGSLECGFFFGFWKEMLTVCFLWKTTVWIEWNGCFCFKGLDQKSRIYIQQLKLSSMQTYTVLCPVRSSNWRILSWFFYASFEGIIPALVCVFSDAQRDAACQSWWPTSYTTAPHGSATTPPYSRNPTFWSSLHAPLPLQNPIWPTPGLNT